MKTISVVLYEFDELKSERAKDRARQWYREAGYLDKWWDCTFDDAEAIGLKLESFDLDRNLNANGKFTERVEEVVRRIRANHGEDCATRKWADGLFREYQVARLRGDGPRYWESADPWDNPDTTTLTDLQKIYADLLQADSNYTYSDENVDDRLRESEFTFTENGDRMEDE